MAFSVISKKSGKTGEVNVGTLARNHGIKRAQLESLIAAFPAHLAIERFYGARLLRLQIFDLVIQHFNCSADYRFYFPECLSRFLNINNALCGIFEAYQH